MSASDILSTFHGQMSSDVITPAQFLELCPVLVYELDVGACIKSKSPQTEQHSYNDVDGEQYPSNHKHTHQEELWEDDHDHDHDNANHTEVTGSQNSANIPFKGKLSVIFFFLFDLQCTIIS